LSLYHLQERYVLGPNMMEQPAFVYCIWYWPPTPCPRHPDAAIYPPTMTRTACGCSSTARDTIWRFRLLNVGGRGRDSGDQQGLTLTLRTRRHSGRPTPPARYQEKQPLSENNLSPILFTLLFSSSFSFVFPPLFFFSACSAPPSLIPSSPSLPLPSFPTLFPFPLLHPTLFLHIPFLSPPSPSPPSLFALSFFTSAFPFSKKSRLKHRPIRVTSCANASFRKRVFIVHLRTKIFMFLQPDVTIGCLRWFFYRLVVPISLSNIYIINKRLDLPCTGHNKSALQHYL